MLLKKNGWIYISLRSSVKRVSAHGGGDWTVGGGAITSLIV